MEDKLKIAMKHFNERESESASLILELEKKVERYEKALKDIDEIIDKTYYSKTLNKISWVVSLALTDNQ